MPIRFLRTCDPIRDIREVHKSDITTADADTESPAEKAFRQLESALSCEGSTEEKQARVLLSQLGIDYDTLTKEEFVTLVGILNKSEHVKNLTDIQLYTRRSLLVANGPKPP